MRPSALVVAAAVFSSAAATAQEYLPPRGHEPLHPAEVPAHRQGSNHGRSEEHGAPPGHAAPAACEQVLADRGGGHHGDSPSVVDAIFHHVTDSAELEFENPFPGTPSAAHVPFKRILCSTLGWNGVLFQSGGFVLDLTPTKHTFWMWVAALLLVLVFTVGAPKKGQLVATGLAGFLEMIVVFIRDELAYKNIGKDEGKRYTPYLCTCFFFILTMNLLGLVPYTGTPTGNLAVTAGLALMTFLTTQLAAIRAAGVGGWLGHLTGGVPWPLWPIMIPVEVLGLFTKPFALCLRLFANMVAGHIVIYFLLGLIFIMKTALLVPVSLAFAMAIYFLELFVALVQAYVFTMLSSLFIGMSVAIGHHGHDEETGHGDARHAASSH